MESILLLKIGDKASYIEIYQDSDNFVNHFVCDENLTDSNNCQLFPSLETAIKNIEITFLSQSTIMYIHPDMEFDIKFLIHQRIKDL